MLRSMAESIMAIALDLAINIDQESTNDAYASFSDRSFPFMLAFLIILLLMVPVLGQRAFNKRFFAILVMLTELD